MKTDRSFVLLQGENYISGKQDAMEKQHAINGMDTSEKIIKGNYFKDIDNLK